MTVVGGDFDSDDSHRIDVGEEWKVLLSISEDAGWVNDILSINGTAHHVDPPHGEGENTNVFQFALTVDADDFSPGNHEKVVSDIQPHGDHFDVFSAKLTFTVETTGWFDDITGYTLVVRGQHVEKRPKEERPKDR